MIGPEWGQLDRGDGPSGSENGGVVVRLGTGWMSGKGVDEMCCIGRLGDCVDYDQVVGELKIW